MLVILSFFIGIGISGTIAGDGTVFMEFCPPSKRHYLTTLSVFSPGSACLGALVAVICTEAGITYV